MLNSKFQANDFLSEGQLEVIERHQVKDSGRYVLSGVDGFDHVRRLFVFDTNEHTVSVYQYGDYIYPDVDNDTKKKIHIQPQHRDKCYQAVRMLVNTIFQPMITIYTTSFEYNPNTATDIDFRPVEEKNPEFLGKWFHYLYNAKNQQEFLKNILFFDYHIEVQLDDRDQGYESLLFAVNGDKIEYRVTYCRFTGTDYIRRSNSVCRNRNNYLYDDRFLLIFDTILAINSGKFALKENYDLMENEDLPNLPIFKDFDLKNDEEDKGYISTWICKE